MPAAADPRAEDWVTAAHDNLADAQALAARHSWRDAYVLAGLAVECALKVRIMRREGLNRWPGRRDRPDLYSHDLAHLGHLAGVTAPLEAEALAGRPLGLAWLVAKDYSIGRRYPDGGLFPVKLGRDTVAAAASDGLVAWLTTHR